MVYHSKKDWWLVALVWAGVLLPFAIGLYNLVAPNGNDHAGWTLLLISILRCIGSGPDLSAPLRNHSIEVDRPLWCDGAKRNTTLINRGSTLDQESAECSSMVNRSAADRLLKRRGS